MEGYVTVNLDTWSGVLATYTHKLIVSRTTLRKDRQISTVIQNKAVIETPTRVMIQPMAFQKFSL